jgi:hypothetical protein
MVSGTGGVESSGRTPAITRTAMRNVLVVWKAMNPRKSTLNMVLPEILLTMILEGIR